MTSAGFFLLLPFFSPASAQDLNVIMVVMDTARADRTTPYGYKRDTTPNLFALAKKAAVFERAWAQSDWTLPGFASMYTGERPGSHGVFAGARLDSPPDTLASEFKNHGFATAAFMNPIIPFDEDGFCRGFEICSMLHVPNSIGSLADTMPKALEWLDQSHGSRFFLVIHGVDVHTPFSCPEPYKFRFDPGRKKPDPQARSEYSDGCLSYEDGVLPSLYRAMDRFRLWDDTVLMVVSDHGDSLGEHGAYGHYARPPYEEIAHIPLIVYHPRLAKPGGRIAAPVEHIDIFPTLMDMEGWPIPPQAEGRSFKNLLLAGGDQGFQERGQYSQAYFYPPGMKFRKVLNLEAFRLGDWKIVRSTSAWELYDLSRDPGEERDLMSAKPETFLRLAAAMMKLKMQGFRPANYDVRVPEDAPCSFPRDQKTARVQCGPSELAYSLETGDFSGAAPDSRVADLAGRLMDHVEAVRFADRKEYRGMPLPSKSALEKLRKAGYVQ